MQFLFKPIFYIVSLLLGTFLVLKIEKLKPSDIEPHNGLFDKEVLISLHEIYPIREKGVKKLNDEEKNFGRIAWKYFNNNYIPKTGLVPATQGGEAVTLKDMGDYMMALVSAWELRIVDSSTFDSRMKSFIGYLDNMELSDEHLPYKYYNVKTGSASHLKKWDPIDIGRFYAFVNKIIFDYPLYHQHLKEALNRWELKNMVFKGHLYQMNEKNEKVPVGRLGSEEYASKNLERVGCDLTESLLYNDFVKFENVNGEQVAVDTRENKSKILETKVENDFYLLDGLECGWDINSKELCYRLYLAQKRRNSERHILVACAETYNDKGSDVLHNTIFADRGAWKCFHDDGREDETLRITAVKTAFAWKALYKDGYAERVFNGIKALKDPENGWYEGMYENTSVPVKVFSSSTNATVLEALNFRANGRLLKFQGF